MGLVVCNKIFLGGYMCAFQCDSCFHKQVCSDEPNTRALNEECALYTNVKNFTDVQQLKAEIALLCAELEESLCYRGRSVNEIIVSMRQLSAI